MKIKKGIPLIDQHDKNSFYGGKFGGNYVAETLKKPIEDLEKLFKKSRNDKSFLKERDNLYDNYVGRPTRFIKLQNLSDHLGGAQIYAKMVSEGTWKDYGLSISSKQVGFSVFKNAAENALYKICKNFKPKNKNLKYLITDTSGKILKNSFDLKILLKSTNWKKLQK